MVPVTGEEKLETRRAKLRSGGLSLEEAWHYMTEAMTDPLVPKELVLIMAKDFDTFVATTRPDEYKRRLIAKDKVASDIMRFLTTVEPWKMQGNWGPNELPEFGEWRYDKLEDYAGKFAGELDTSSLHAARSCKRGTRSRCSEGRQAAFASGTVETSSSIAPSEISVPFRCMLVGPA